MKTNYHTHTTRCQHADGADRDYVEAALAGGFDELGFADHAPFPYRNGYVSSIRMPMSDFEDYVQSVTALRGEYSGRIRIHLGLEAEYFPRYREHLEWMRDRGVQYYVLGQHYISSEEDHPYIGFPCKEDDGVKEYADAVCEGIASGLYLYVAHPDLFMRHRTEDQYNAACEAACRQICETAASAGMPIEYNLLGLGLQRIGKNRGYPSRHFWEQARQYGCKTILGVDAHNPRSLTDLALWENGVSDLAAYGYERVEQMEINR